MQQYQSIKDKHPDALLLFRVGDFYETFGEDAIKTSQILDIVLTKRANGKASHVELAGFPHHALDTYLPKLVRSGLRVAICDQLEDPKQTKSIVKRGVTELVSPGVTLHDQILNAKSNNFFASIYIHKSSVGIAFLDVSTGEFLTAEGNKAYIEKLLQSFSPSEIIYSAKDKNKINEWFTSGFFETPQSDWIFQFDYAYEFLTQHFKSKSLKGFGIEDLPNAIIAAGSALKYLHDNQHHRLDHINSLSRIVESDFVWMDQFTIRNLELFNSNSPDGRSLLDAIDHTTTSMGARMIRRWLALPLKNELDIIGRQNVVEFFKKKTKVVDDLVEQLDGLYDLERLASKIATGRINPKEVNALKSSIQKVETIRNSLSHQKEAPFSAILKKLTSLSELFQVIDSHMNEDVPLSVNKGNVIKTGVDGELDEFRMLLSNGKEHLESILKREIEKTGIPSLKIAFNNVFGYYLEVRNTHKDKVPEEWIRKQTLVSAERYITQELKEYETKILSAEDQISTLESKLYNELVSRIQAYISLIQQNAHGIGELDCLINFALLSRSFNYNKPVFSDNNTLCITNGRHPVIEQQLPPDNPDVANSISLNKEDQQIIMITGPNMSGKSALLRQTALIGILAQIGCFVPAKSASLPILDKIFVRVGASDNISQGESTFMVEMNETASILNNLSENSLVLLDEIGRGTSTYDGVSIAWGISEFLHNHPSKPFTLFATHYHELNEMSNDFNRIKNFNVSIKEVGDKIIFLRKLEEGGSAHSFGIHVAQMAGMPKFVINKANKVLKQLEASREKSGNTEALRGHDLQLSFFKLDDPLLEEIKNDLAGMDINTLTPVEALMVLNEWKNKLGIQ